MGRRGRPPAPAPRLAAGTELLGRYKDSGLREPPWLVRRADGRVVQLTELLYAVAGSLDGASSLKTVATRVSAAIGRTVTSENVLFLLENKLCPLGLVAGTAPMAPGPMDAGPLQLTMRGRLLPASVVGAVARLFQPLFAAGAVGGVLGLVAAADLWLFAHHGLTRAFHQLIVRPELVVVVFGLVVASVLFHELGHAAACRYGGARPGVIGIGLYLIYPAFYTDVTDVYRLGRGGRIRTDLGGIYFNLVFVVGLYAAYAATGFEPLLAVVAIEHALVANQYWPWLRLDGYYVLNDLTGVPDVLSRVGPVLRSLVPGRAVDPRAGELKPWVRWVLTAYALVLVPVLVGGLGRSRARRASRAATGPTGLRSAAWTVTARSAPTRSRHGPRRAARLFRAGARVCGRCRRRDRIRRQLAASGNRGPSGRPRRGLGADPLDGPRPRDDRHSGAVRPARPAAAGPAGELGTGAPGRPEYVGLADCEQGTYACGGEDDRPVGGVRPGDDDDGAGHHEHRDDYRSGHDHDRYDPDRSDDDGRTRHHDHPDEYRSGHDHGRHDHQCAHDDRDHNRNHYDHTDSDLCTGVTVRADSALKKICERSA